MSDMSANQAPDWARNTAPVRIPKGLRGRGRPAKYPWASWCKPVHDHAFLLIRGKDYTCTTLSLIQQFRRKAEEFGVTPNWEYPTDVTLNEADQVLIWATPAEDEVEVEVENQDSGVEVELTPYLTSQTSPQPSPVTVLVDNPWELLPTKPFSR